MSKTDEISSARTQVDEIDGRIVALLAERFKITRKIGTYKAAHNMISRDQERENFQLDTIAKKAKAGDLNPELARQILQLVIDEAVKEHQEIRTRRDI